MLNRLFVMAVTWAGIAGSADAQTRPSSLPADPWLGRASAGAAALRREPDADGPLRQIASDAVLAVCIADLRDSPDDRALLAEMARAAERHAVAEPDARKRLFRFFGAAELFVSAGRPGDARRLLPELEKGRALRDEFPQPSPAGALPSLYVQLGELTPDRLAAVDVSELSTLARIAAGDGDDQTVARLAAEVRRRTDPLPELTPEHRRSALRALCAAGDFDAAAAVAGMKPHDTHHVPEALADVARRAAAAGEPEGATRALAAAVRAAAATDPGSRWVALATVVTAAGDLRNSTAVGRVIRPLAPRLLRPPGPRDGLVVYAAERAARACAAVANTTARDQFLTWLQGTADAAEPPQRAQRWLAIANVYARAADRERAAGAVAKARRAGDLPAGDWSIYYGLPEAFAAAGDYDAAFAAVRDGIAAADDRDWHHYRIGIIAARAGRFDRAADAAAAAGDGWRRWQVLRLTTVERTKTGAFAGLADWIDRLPSRRMRVILDLAVAQQLSGRANTTKLYAFQPQ